MVFKKLKKGSFFCKKCGLYKEFEDRKKAKIFKQEHRRLWYCGMEIKSYKNKKGNLCKVFIRPELLKKVETGNEENEV